MSHDDIERRIKAAKSKRERLVSDRAEKVARQRAAQEKLSKLEEKAEANGFKLEDLDDILAQKRADLETALSEFEDKLDKAEERLATYED